MMLNFPILADYALIYADGLNMFATHGHLYNNDNLPPLNNGDILLHGHTHIPIIKDMGTYMYINPGSVSIPKENSEHSYLTIENGEFILHALK